MLTACNPRDGPTLSNRLHLRDSRRASRRSDRSVSASTLKRQGAHVRLTMGELCDRWCRACEMFMIRPPNQMLNWNYRWISYIPWQPSVVQVWLDKQEHEWHRTSLLHVRSMKTLQLLEPTYREWTRSPRVRHILRHQIYQWMHHVWSLRGHVSMYGPKDYRLILQLCWDLQEDYWYEWIYQYALHQAAMRQWPTWVTIMWTHIF